MAKMAKNFGVNSGHTPTRKGTSQGRKPITSTMNKSKKRHAERIKEIESSTGYRKRK